MSESESKRLTDALAKVVTDVFSSIANISVKVTVTEDTEQVAPPFDVSGIIGITGGRRGSLVVSLPREFATKLTESILGPSENPDDPESVEDDLCDCMSELTNVIGGNLLPILTESSESPTRLSLPSTVLGKEHMIWRREDVPYHRAEFESEYGPVSVALSLRDSGS